MTHAHFGGSIAAIPFTDIPVYIAITAFVINAIVAVVLTVVFRALKVKDGVDSTNPSDYGADENDPKVADMEKAIEAELLDGSDEAEEPRRPRFSKPVHPAPAGSQFAAGRPCPATVSQERSAALSAITRAGACVSPRRSSASSRHPRPAGGPPRHPQSRVDQDVGQPIRQVPTG